MAVHDTVCVPPWEGYYPGENPPFETTMLEAGPARDPGRIPAESIVEWDDPGERIGAFLEIQVKPGEAEEPPRILLWNPGRSKFQPGPPRHLRRMVLELTPAEWI